MDEIDRAVAFAHGVVMSRGREGMTINEFVQEYRKMTGEDLEFEKFGYPDLKSFLVNMAGMTFQNSTLYCSSEDAAHISELIDGQASKPKRLANGFGRKLPITKFPMGRPITKMTSRPGSSSHNQISLQRMYPECFRHELRLKLAGCRPGVTMEDFIKYFNESNFAKFGVRKDLDFKGLPLLDFFQGLNDVFSVETLGDQVKLYPALKNSGPTRNQDLYSKAVEDFNSIVRPPIFETRPFANSHSSKQLMPVNEIVKVLKKINESCVNQEVTLEDYHRKMSEIGGEGATNWLEVKNFSRENFFDFVIKNSTGFQFETVRNKSALRISSTNDEYMFDTPDSQSVSRASSLQSLPGKPAMHEPYTHEIAIERLRCDGRVVDIIVDDFDMLSAKLHFSLIEHKEERRKLMNDLRIAYAGTPDGQLIGAPPGTLCVAPYESCEETLYRAVILNTQNKQSELYYVDFGMKDVMPEKKLREIKTQFKTRSAFAYPAVIANAYPVDGKENFDYKTLQIIKLKLEAEVMKASLIRYCEKLNAYELDMTEALLPLQEEGYFVLRKPNEIPRFNTNGNSTMVEVKQQNNLDDFSYEIILLSTCETFVKVKRNHKVYIPSSIVSSLLGSNENDFLTTLAENFIYVSETWNAYGRTLQKLIDEAGMDLVSEEVMIPVEAVAPLMRAYLEIRKTTVDSFNVILEALAD